MYANLVHSTGPGRYLYQGMLNDLDLSQKLPREDYRTHFRKLTERLARLQREAIELDIPVILILEGWEAAGKGELMNRLIRHLDPRYYNVHTTREPTREEKLRPFLWRFWQHVPARGQMVIFDRSWYGSLIRRFAGNKKKRKSAQELCDHGLCNVCNA